METSSSLPSPSSPSCVGVCHHHRMMGRASTAKEMAHSPSAMLVHCCFVGILCCPLLLLLSLSINVSIVSGRVGWREGGTHLEGPLATVIVPSIVVISHLSTAIPPYRSSTAVAVAAQHGPLGPCRHCCCREAFKTETSLSLPSLSSPWWVMVGRRSPLLSSSSRCE
jgi:hypothetical protein